jgi:hypothetical protein
MADTKTYSPQVVEQARQALESEQAPPPKPKVHYFVADFRHDDPEQIGFARGFQDRHQNWLVQPRAVPVDHPHCERVFSFGELVACDDTDAHLRAFLEGNRMFRRAKHSEVSAKDRIND